MYPVQSVDFALNNVYSGMSTSISNLSMEMLINNADEYTGMTLLSDSLRSDIADNQAKIADINEGISLVQTTDDAAEAIHKKLDQMKIIAAAAAEGGHTQAELNQMQADFDELLDEVNVIAAATTPDNNLMLTKAEGSVSVSLGSGLSIDINTADLSITGLGIIENIDLSSDAQAVLDGVEDALVTVADYETHLEAKMDTLAATSATLDAHAQSLLATQSAVESADAGMMMIAILNGNSSAMEGLYLIAQSNINTNMVLQLLAD